MLAAAAVWCSDPAAASKMPWGRTARILSGIVLQQSSCFNRLCWIRLMQWNALGLWIGLSIVKVVTCVTISLLHWRALKSHWHPGTRLSLQQFSCPEEHAQMHCHLHVLQLHRIQICNNSMPATCTVLPIRASIQAFRLTLPIKPGHADHTSNSNGKSHPMVLSPTTMQMYTVLLHDCLSGSGPMSKGLDSETESRFWRSGKDLNPKS